MTISIPSRPHDVEAALQRWIQADEGIRTWLGGGFQWGSDGPVAVVGWVHAGEFQLRERHASSRYAWCPVGRGQIVPTVAGTDLRIAMRPWTPDLLVPAILLALGAYQTWRFASATPLLVTLALAAVGAGVGWTIGVRRIHRALRAHFRLPGSASP